MCLKTVIMFENAVCNQHFPVQTLENSLKPREEKNGVDVFLQLFTYEIELKYT